MIRIFIAEDLQIVLDGLVEILGQEPTIQVVGTALNGEVALQKMESLEVDVAVLDIKMPVLDGIETAKRIKQKYKGVKILFLTGHNDMRYIRQAMNMNAEGYILKDCPKEELVDAISIVHQGKTYEDDKVSKKVMDNLRNPPIGELTKRELEIAKWIADGFIAKEIAEELNISFNTVNTHKNNAIQKLGLKNSNELVKYVMKNGLIEY